MFWIFRTFLCLLLVHGVTPEVFLHTKDANQVIKRFKRANSFLEELKQGDMERECQEERCSFEEAREIYEDDKKTIEFWNIYVDGDSCKSQPCLNNGVCKDGINKYTCFCPELFQGYNCEIAIPELCVVNNGGCEHFCKVDDKKGSAVCSCATGYEIGPDKKECISDEPFKCGYVFPKASRSNLVLPIENITNSTENDMGPMIVPEGIPEGNVVLLNEKNTLADDNLTQADNMSLFGLIEPLPTIIEEPVLPEVAGDNRIVNGANCPPGECPWQALLVNEHKVGFCGGTIINEYFILSAAHCMNLSQSITVILGETDILVPEGREAIHAVEQVLIHSSYQSDTYNNDIALIKLVKPITFTKYIIPACLPSREFAENVLMKEKEGMVSGFGRLYEGGVQATILQKLNVPYVDRSTCKESTKYTISPRMFCAGYQEKGKDACQGDSGGPHVTKYRSTWFVTGVVSWGEGCARENKYGVYTQVSKYLKWIEIVMKQVLAETRSIQKSRKKRQMPGKVPVIRI